MMKIYLPLTFLIGCATATTGPVVETAPVVHEFLIDGEKGQMLSSDSKGAGDFPIASCRLPKEGEDLKPTTVCYGYLDQDVRLMKKYIRILEVKLKECQKK